MAVSLAGVALEQQRLWNTYMFWARSACDPKTANDPVLEIGKPGRRARLSAERFLQSVVFVAFTVEYRLKAVYEALGIAPRKRDALGILIQNFRRRVEIENRLDGAGFVRLPVEWKRIERKLVQLNQIRNQIAHGDSTRVLAIIPSNARPARRVAAGYFNALVDVIRVTHRAIGDISDPINTPGKARSYYAGLKVRVA